VTFMIPNSSAMDATASCGGPGTFVWTISTGSPEQIATLVTQRLRQAEQFLEMVEQLTSASRQLQKVWSGGASESAVQKITSSVAAFEKIAKVIQTGATLLGTSGALVQTAQSGYTSVVSAVNPTVSGLMSNWWTYSAAVALSTATSAALRGFLTAIEGLLEALGGGQLLQQIMTLAQIIAEIEQLANGGGQQGGQLPGGTIGNTPIVAPITPPQIASLVGQQVSTSGLDPTVQQELNGYQQNNGYPPGYQSPNFQNPTFPTGVSGGQYPGGQFPGGQYPPTGNDAGDSWIPVNPPSAPTPPVAHPTPGPPVSGHPAPGHPAPGHQKPPAHHVPPSSQHDITVTMTEHGVSTSVEIPTGHATEITLSETVDGHTYTEHIDVSANGNVSIGN
jgi:hypothetical protein